MENHHFSWENPLCPWPFSIATLDDPEANPPDFHQESDPPAASWEDHPASRVSSPPGAPQSFAGAPARRG